MIFLTFSPVKLPPIGIMAPLIWLNLKTLLLPVTNKWRINKTLLFTFVIKIELNYNYYKQQCTLRIFIRLLVFFPSNGQCYIYITLNKFELTIFVGNFSIAVSFFTSLTLFYQSPGVSNNRQYYDTHANTESMAGRLEMLKVGHSHGLETRQTGIEL